MVDAALVGDGFERMAELAAEEVGAAGGDRGAGARRRRRLAGRATTASSTALERFADARGSRRAARDPAGRRAGRAGHVRRRLVGSVGDAGGRRRRPRRRRASSSTSPRPRARPRSRSRRRASATTRRPGGLVEGLLARQRSTRTRPRGARPPSGCDLAERRSPSSVDRGALEPAARGARGGRPSECPGALAELVGDRLYALAARRGRGRRRRSRERLRAYGPTAVSSSYADPRDAARGRCARRS